MSEPVANAYLEQEVLSASPAKLRWLLIDKAAKLSQIVGELWNSGERDLGDQWALRLREILNELLSGVQSDTPVAQQVCDLYIFQLKLLTEAELGRDFAKLDQLRGILEIEAETWRLVQQKLAEPHLASPPPPLGGLWSSSSTNESSLCIDA